MGESFRFAHFSCVPTIHSLVNVLLKVLIGYIVITANNHPSEVTPKALNAVGEYVTIGILFCTVSNNSVSITQLCKTIVGTEFISDDS